MFTIKRESQSFLFSLTHNRDEQFITMSIKGLMMENEFKTNTWLMFDLLNESNINKLLVDTRTMDYISFRDQLWLTDYFIPYACVNGLRAVSFIKPENRHTRLCLENVMYQIPEPLLPAAWFSSETEAKGWISEINI